MQIADIVTDVHAGAKCHLLAVAAAVEVRKEGRIPNTSFHRETQRACMKSGSGARHHRKRRYHHSGSGWSQTRHQLIRGRWKS
jgi:hypothetical protein